MPFDTKVRVQLVGVVFLRSGLRQMFDEIREGPYSWRDRRFRYSGFMDLFAFALRQGLPTALWDPLDRRIVRLCFGVKY